MRYTRGWYDRWGGYRTVDRPKPLPLVLEQDLLVERLDEASQDAVKPDEDPKKLSGV